MVLVAPESKTQVENGCKGIYVYNINADALGDNISCLPAIMEHVRLTPEYEHYINSKYWDLFKIFGLKPFLNPYDIKNYIEIKIFPDGFDRDPEYFMFLHRSHLCIVAQQALGVKSNLEMPIVTPPQNREKTVIISASSYDILRFIPPLTISYLCKKLIEFGYTPILVGNTLNRNMYAYYYVPNIKGVVNLINQTTFLDTLRLINEASAVVTPDSGLMWLTFLTNTPMVVSFFNVDPAYRMIQRNADTILLIPECECRFCFTKGSIGQNKIHNCQVGKTPEEILQFKASNWECQKSITYKSYWNALKKILKF